MKNSWLDVQLCKEGAQDCFASNNTTIGGVLKFPRHSNEETVLQILIHLRVVLCTSKSTLSKVHICVPDLLVIPSILT